MSQLEQLLALFAEFGIETDVKRMVGYTDVVLHAKTAKVAGYGGFFCEFSFNADGVFTDAGVWE